MFGITIGHDYKTPQNDMFPSLDNTLTDAALMAKTYREMGARDVLSLENPSLGEIEQKVAQFVVGLPPQATLVFYYAGHAVQVAGENYILISSTEALALSWFVETIGLAAETAIFFFDACRDNPFGLTPVQTNVKEESLRIWGGQKRSVSMEQLRSAGSGLAAVTVPRSNLLISYSTSPGSVAQDACGACGSNGPYALALSRQLKRQIDLDLLLARVGENVKELTRPDDNNTATYQATWFTGNLTRQVWLAGQPMQAIP